MRRPPRPVHSRPVTKNRNLAVMIVWREYRSHCLQCFLVLILRTARHGAASRRAVARAWIRDVMQRRRIFEAAVASGEVDSDRQADFTTAEDKV